MKAYIVKDTAIRGKPAFKGDVVDVQKADFEALIECKKAEPFDPAKHQTKKG